MRIYEILARPANYQAWGSSHENSQLIAGEAARHMNIPDYRMGEVPNPKARNLASAFLAAIANSPGSPEPLYHGFQNRKNIQWRIGQIISIPLTATSGDMDGSAGYGMRNNQEAPPTVLAFPAGTKFAGYAKWGKQDAADFGHLWSEAIVAGKFRVIDIKTRRQYGWSDTPEYTIVYLQPVEIFDPQNGSWMPHEIQQQGA